MVSNVKCIRCGSTKVIKTGKRDDGVQRYKCKDCNKIFQNNYVNRASRIKIENAVYKDPLKWVDIKKISDILGVSQKAVISEFKYMSKNSQFTIKN